MPTALAKDVNVWPHFTTSSELCVRARTPTSRASSRYSIAGMSPTTSFMYSLLAVHAYPSSSITIEGPELDARRLTISPPVSPMVLVTRETKSFGVRLR